MARDTSGPRSLGSRPPRSRFPPGDPRGLEAAIRDATIRAQVYGLTQQALRALEGLSRLDDTLYTRFMEAGGSAGEDPASIALLRRVAGVTFRGTRVLLAGLARLHPEGTTNDAPESHGDLDFDFGSEQLPAAEPFAPADEPGPEGPDFNDLDIDDALNVIDADERDEPSRWAELREKATAIEYGIRSQTGEFDSRFNETLEAGKYAAALEGLDDSRSAVGEGVVALLIAIYQAFQPEVDTSLVAPGYLSSLARALLVRRSLADLAAKVEPKNAIVQREAAKPDERDRALGEVREALSQFIQSPGFKAMRPGDRWELTKFDRAFAEVPASEARMTSEGFAKYLDSLGSINRREVLVTHDQRTMHELRETLSAARPLLEYNTGVARDMVLQALATSEQLYGRSRSSDELITALREADPTLASAAEVEAVLSTLELLLDDAT
jgi:hypothetical protein